MINGFIFPFYEKCVDFDLSKISIIASKIEVYKICKKMHKNTMLQKSQNFIVYR